MCWPVIPIVISVLQEKKPELPGRLRRDDRAWSTTLSTILETTEAIDLDSWSGCVTIFAITTALVIHVPSHIEALRLLITY